MIMDTSTGAKTAYWPRHRVSMSSAERSGVVTKKTAISTATMTLATLAKFFHVKMVFRFIRYVYGGLRKVARSVRKWLDSAVRS